jgi:hypothetical protein
MCRFNLDVQSDVDNYRKVQRNLQMLCADALVGSLKLKQGHGKHRSAGQRGLVGSDLHSTTLPDENFCYRQDHT